MTTDKELQFVKLSVKHNTMSWWILVKMYLKHVLGRVWKRLLLYFLAFGILMIVIDLSGVLRHFLELDYDTQFSYPVDLPDFRGVIDKYMKNQPVPVQPINTLHQNITFLETADDGCGGPQFRLIILIKSAGMNFKKRAVIRSTWGNPKRFSDVHIKTIFLLGRVGNPRQLTNLLDGKLRPVAYTITAESGRYKDIVLGDFRDTYYNNTLKTLVGMRWLTEICPNYRFAYFTDDDMYVSVKNLLKFVRNPAEYPQYWEKLKDNEEKRREEAEVKRRKKKKLKSGSILTLKVTDEQINRKLKSLIPESIESSLRSQNLKNDPADFDIDLAEDAKLFAGNVYFVPPLRHALSNKWYVSLDEYPFHYYPPYIPAGSMLMSKPVVSDLYYGSAFTKSFRFDDVYLGIVAKKMGIEPFNSNYFEMNQKPVSYYSEEYKHIIAVHDFEPDQLKELWFIQKTLGNV